MKLSDTRFWIWLKIIAFMPILMSAFAALFLVNSVSELLYLRNVELFIVWEIAYMLGGLLTYRKINNNDWRKGTLITWSVCGAFLLIVTFVWAEIKISDGFRNCLKLELKKCYRA